MQHFLLPYRKTHVSELLDETIHDPGFIWLVAHLPLTPHKQDIIHISVWQQCGTDGFRWK